MSEYEAWIMFSIKERINNQTTQFNPRYAPLINPINLTA